MPSVDGTTLAPGVELTARLAGGSPDPVRLVGTEAAAALTPEAADGWATAFGSALAALVTMAPRADKALAPGQRRRLEAPDVLVSRRGVCWLEPDIPGLAGFGVGMARGPLAITPDAWAQATVGGTARAAAARFLWANGALLDALLATQEAWVAALPMLAALAEVDRHQAERNRRTRADVLLRAAERQALALPLPATPPSGDEPALTVMAAIAHRLGLPLKAPQRRRRSISDQPYTPWEVAAASHFRMRRVAKGERLRPSGKAPLVAIHDGMPRLVTRMRDMPADDGVLLVPVRPLPGVQATPLALLRAGTKGGVALRLALLDRLLRLPTARLQAHDGDRWVGWMKRLEGLGGQPAVAGALGVAAILLAASLATLAALVGWRAAMLTVGLAALTAPRWRRAAQTGLPGKDDGDDLAVDDPATLAMLERLPKIQTMAAAPWLLLTWYRNRQGGHGLGALPCPTLRNAASAAALGAAPLLGAALAGGPGAWTGAGAMTLGTLTGGMVLGHGLAMAGALRRDTVPGVPGGVFDLDGKGPPEYCDPGGLTGHVAVVDLAARLVDEERWLFTGLSLTVAPGEFIALAGPPGCGKSTLLALLRGLRRPTAGAVFLDGHDLSTLDPAILARDIAVVGQRDRLRPSTIRNMLTGQRAVDDDALWSGLKAVGMRDTIAALPAGLDTRLALGHGALSHGEAQRLLLARAFLAPAAILLLDEPTSMLDAAAEAIVAETLRRLPVTRIVATHRPALIRAADRIIDLGAHSSRMA
ncbi:ATP-binding cassette domain-containing protein [Azospirillum sp. B510]|uniref:ATP-binding cassette domain-containing protein n=1 Tax=Azospirillum sp. (strain B510) TaxID=137722 RepID=UPI003528D853